MVITVEPVLVSGQNLNTTEYNAVHKSLTDL